MGDDFSEVGDDFNELGDDFRWCLKTVNLKLQVLESSRPSRIITVSCEEYSKVAAIDFGFLASEHDKLDTQGNHIPFQYSFDFVVQVPIESILNFSWRRIEPYRLQVDVLLAYWLPVGVLWTPYQPRINSPQGVSSIPNQCVGPISIFY